MARGGARDTPGNRVTISLVIDMNLPPRWVDALKEEGFEATHWSEIGDPRASDEVILSWAKDHGRVVFTHDLDFGAILAATRADSPSVLQVRTQDTTPEHLTQLIVHVLREYEHELEEGALIAVDESTSRARILPI